MNKTKADTKSRPAPAKTWPATEASEAERLDRWIGDPSFMLSLARGLLVLQAVIDAEGSKCGISEIATATGLSRPTVRRCLYSLDALEYLNVDRGKASPGPRMASLTAAYLASSPLLASCQSVLDQLRAKLGRTVTLGIRENFEAVYIAESYHGTLLQLHIPVGTRFPLYCTSLGRLFLAVIGDEEFREYMGSILPTALTQFTITSEDEIYKAICEVRRQGYSIVDQEVEIGLRSISVPIVDRRKKVVAGLSIGTHRDLISARELRSTMLPEMQAAAEKLSTLLP
jgi:IclR family pca regulon transcriptional regulator